MDRTLNELHTIIYNVADAVQTKKTKEKKNILDHIAIKALEGTFQRLKRIECMLNVPKYDLVFIGQVGAGKTTAICHLFDLVEPYSGSIKLASGKTKEVTKVRELLSTGSGQTTICEVVIKPASETFLEIEPYDRQNLEELIREFAWYIWLKAHPRPDENGAQPPPTELMRAIRNVVELNVLTTAEGRVDQAIEFVKKYGENQFDAFQAAVLQRAKLDARTQTIARPNADVVDGDVREKAWIRKAFELLNLAKVPNISIPKKIFVNVSAQLFQFDESFNRFGSIVDTKGMDVGQSREDLDNYIRNSDSALCIFAEKFPPAPANVADIIERHLVAQDIATKFALFVMPHKGEPAKVVGKDGPVGDHDEGIALRRATIDAAFTSRNIDFISDNVLFFDALQGYLPDGRLDQDYDQEDVLLDRKRIFTALQNIIERREAILWDEVEALNTNFEAINQEEYGLSFQDKDLLDFARDKVKSYQNLSFATANNFVQEYLALWNSSNRHFMSLRATNNRFGRYEPRNIDVYYDAVPIAEKLARKIMDKPKNDLFETVHVIGENGSEDLGRLMKMLEVQINTDYQKLIVAIGQEMRGLFEGKIMAPQGYDSTFWRQAIERWGQGPGYRADVLGMYSSEAEIGQKYLKERMAALWHGFVGDVLSFLG